MAYIRELVGGEPSLTEQMEMRGRVMTGWLRVDAAHLKTTRQLSKWVDLGVSYARSLPPKRR